MKRTLALLMALLLFLTSSAPTAKVFAQGDVPETGGEAKHQTILEAPNPTVENGKEGTLPSNGGAINIRYASKGVKANEMEVVVLKDGKALTSSPFNTPIAHPDDSQYSGVQFSGKLPQNDTTKDVVYKFYIKEKADTKYDEKNVITITVKAKNTAEPTITGVNRTEIVLEPDSPSRYITLNFTGYNLSGDVVKTVTKKDGAVTDDIDWNFISIGDDFMASAPMPAAPEDKDIVYTTTFSTANDSSQTVKITVKAKSGAASTEKTLTGMTIKPESLPRTGGDVEITLQGENLEPTDIEPIIVLIRGGRKNFPIKWTEVPEGLKTTLTIPENTSGAEQKYSIKFLLKSDTTKNVFKNVTVTTNEGPVAPAVPTVKGLIADPVSLPTTGGNVALTVKAENAKASDIQWTVKKDGKPVSDLTPDAKDDRNFTLALPKNDTANDVTYTVEAKAANDAQWKPARITVAKKATTPPVVQDSKIMMMTDVNEKIDAASSEKTFPVIATPNTDAKNVKLHITANGKDVILPYTVTGAKSKKTVTITFPENKKASPVVYKITFNATGSESVFQDDPVATFTQAAGEAVNASISDVSATNDQLPLAGGNTTITIKGTDLDKAKLVTKLYKVEDGVEKEVKLADYMTGNFQGRDNVQSAPFTFPEVNKDTKFVFKASVDGGNTFVEKAIHQTSEGSNRETEALEPKKVFTILDNTLVVDFHEPVQEARANAIMKNVHILAGSDTVNIGPDDKVTFDGNTLQIKFKDPIFKDVKTYKLVVDARTFKLFNEKENREKENKAFESIIQKDGPYIEDAKFEQGYKLESTGGKVVLKLKGYNLPEDLKVKILENDKEKTPLNVTPEITGSPNERTITFTAPANTTDRVQSYSVLVSTDGVQYSSEVSNMQNRFRRMVVSVLPKDAEADAPQIDFMQIQSYGNADDGDTTHTNLPTGQESKKTLVWIYGTNLNADHTRLRLIDKNGVYWSPIYDATQDSGTRILMTMLDGINGGTPGMTGKGNNMLMEVILPRGYQPDKWPGYEEGTTFKYEVAPDGVHFDSEVTVTATVRFDGEDSKKDLTPLLTDVTVRHVDKDGKDIVPAEKVKAYNHLHPCDLQKLLPLRDKDGFKKDFEGYKVADTDEIVKGMEGPNHYGSAYYDGKTVKELKNSKGEIVLVYGKAEKPVDPSNPSDPTNPSNPSNPSTPSKPDSPSDKGSGSGHVVLPSAPANKVVKPEEKPAPKKETSTTLTKGYIAGYPDHTFRPAKSMTRAEAAAILARLCKLTGMDSTKPDFKDADGWYNAAINDVVKAGYMKGYPDGSFKPDQPITRAEFAAILSHVLKDTTAPNPFKDTAGHWAKDAIDKAYAQGIIKGYGDNSFRPDALVSRAEAVAMANRTFRLQKTVVDNPFTDISPDHWAYNDILTAVSNK
ncbi:S-layer homology domain-containing protein [Aedoeadaptatus urinae]|uniref:S-layer homology domain-containing protein n=1 Tax=Aedoeadaptatus urinae TaxID=1871017 RepID=UPI00097D130F|nr:S-layer homology domain-containing protein [Peptoniphilus urinae]